MTFTDENTDRLFTAPGALRGVLADVCASGFDVDGDGVADGMGLICPDADLYFGAGELGLFDAYDVIDEMRADLPNLKHIWRDDDGARVMLVAVTGEMLVASYEVIERRHRFGRVSAAGAGWALAAFDAGGFPVPVGMAKKNVEPSLTKTVMTAEGLRTTVARMFAGWVTDEMRRARARKRGQMKRQTEKNRAKAIGWLEELHGSLEAGDRESHRDDLDGAHWLEGFDDPELAYAVARYRESGRDVLRVLWLDLTSVDDVSVDLKRCRVESIDAAEIIGEDGVRAILEWDDESRMAAGSAA